MVTTRRGTATDPNAIKEGGQQAAGAAGVKRSASAAGNKEKKETKPAKKEAKQDVKQAEQEEEKVEGSVTVTPAEKPQGKAAAPAPAPEVEMKDAAPTKEENQAPARADSADADEAKKREAEQAEQKRKEEEARKLAEEQQRKEEERKKAAEEQRKKEEEAAAEAKRKEEERQKAEAERTKQEEEQKQAEAKRAEEERQKAEAARKEQERKAEEERKKAEELKRQEEERKKEEDRQLVEATRKAEEEQRKRDEERKQQEEEQQRKKEEEQRKEEERKKEEQRKLQEEVQRKATESSAQQPTQPSAAPSTTPGSTQQTTITQFSEGGSGAPAAPKADGANHHADGPSGNPSMPSHAKQEAVVGGERKPADEILEKGQVYFFFRARVDEGHPESLKDIARVYVILRPFPKDAALADQGSVSTGGRNRVIVLPKKMLPQSPKDRFMAFVELAGASMSDVQEKVLQAGQYDTQTQGTRQVQPAKPIGEGVYALTQAGERRETHLAYSLTMPVPLTDQSKEFGLAEQGSFIISAKNPKFGGPSNAQLPDAPKFPEKYYSPDILEKHANPSSILATFGNYRWSPLQPAMLDYANAQFLLIGSSHDNELSDGAAPAAEELERLEHEDTKRVESLKRDHAVFADLGLSKQQPGLQRGW